MALRFENQGTSLIVRQYIDRSREMFRQELASKLAKLFGDFTDETFMALREVESMNDLSATRAEILPKERLDVSFNSNSATV